MAKKLLLGITVIILFVAGCVGPPAQTTMSQPKPPPIEPQQPTLVPATLSEPPVTGDWIISKPSIVQDTSVTLNGNLIVKSGGSLTLTSAKLTVNTSHDGEFGISVERGGSFVANHSTITSGNPQFRFSFVVKGDRFEMLDSALQGCGWGIPYAPYKLPENGLYLENVALVSIKRSTFSKGFFGVILQSGHSALVSNNTFSEIDESGVFLSRGTDNSTIDGNTFSCRLFGVKGQGANWNTISNNTFSDSFVEAPIWFLGASEHNLITGNTISISNSWGCIALGSDGGQVANNNIVSNNNITFLSRNIGGNNGIAIFHGTNNRIENNTVTDSQVGVTLGYSNGNDIVGNTLITKSSTLDAVQQNAIALYHSSNNTVANNSISSALEHGILLLNSSADNLLEGNSLQGCWRGIGLFNHADGNKIINNSVAQSTEKSVILQNSNHNVVYANDFVSNVALPSDDGVNQWDYEGKGNYWSNYKGKDSDGDGAGDTSQPILPGGADHRPLMSPVSIAVFTVSKREDVPLPVFPPGTLNEDMITTDVVWQNMTINYQKAQQLTIAKGGSLTLKDSTLVLPWYVRNIMVQAGGKLNIIHSKVMPAESAGGFELTVQKNGTLVMTNSELTGSGFAPFGSDWGGLKIKSTDVTIENSIIADTPRGIGFNLSAPDIKASSLSIKGNTISDCYIPFWAFPNVQGYMENNTFKNYVRQ